MRLIRILTGYLSVTILMLATVQGGVTRFEIKERTPFADGVSFGQVGAYEHLSGYKNDYCKNV